MSNPLSGFLAQQNQQQSGMVKSLASSFLSSTSTVLEYDLQQARNMQGGILFNLAFMWFLHFKMEQVQPLLMTTANGLINLYYSPLFQAYVLNRNLERPFKTQQAIMQAQQQDEDDNDETESPANGAEATSTAMAATASASSSKGTTRSTSPAKRTEKTQTEEPEEEEEDDDYGEEADDESDDEEDESDDDEEGDSEGD